MVFHWSLSDSKSHQVSWTVRAVLNNVVVWMVSTRSFISKSSSPFNNPLVTVQKAPITIGIIVTFMFQSLFFFNFLAKVEIFMLLFTFFQFYSVVSRNNKGHNFENSLFLLLLIIIRSSLLAEIRWSVFMSKSHKSLCVFSRTVAVLCIYHLLIWSNLNFLHISQWIPLPTQSCLVLYSFWANLLHSLIMWLMVSSLSPHSLHLLFCCVLSFLALIWLVLMELFCVVIRRDFVSLLKFTFLAMSRFFRVRCCLLVV